MDKRKLFLTIITLVIAAALPVVIFLTQQNQDNRQKAGLEQGITLALANPNLTVGEGTIFEVALTIAPTLTDLNSFDITLIGSTDAVEFVDFTALPTGFIQVIKTIDTDGKKLRILSINQEGTQFSGSLLGTVKMRAKGSGQGTITFQTLPTIITAKSADAPLPISNTSETLGNYSFSSQTGATSAPISDTTSATPIPPTVVSTPTTVDPTAPTTASGSLPAPTGLTTQCDSSGKKVTISWTPYTGTDADSPYPGYFVILDKNPSSYNYENPATDDSPMIAGATTIQPSIELEPGVKYAVDVVIIPKGMQYQEQLKYNPPASQHARQEFTCTVQ